MCMMQIVSKTIHPWYNSLPGHILFFFTHFCSKFRSHPNFPKFKQAQRQLNRFDESCWWWRRWRWGWDRLGKKKTEIFSHKAIRSNGGRFKIIRDVHTISVLVHWLITSYCENKHNLHCEHTHVLLRGLWFMVISETRPCLWLPHGL